MISSLLVAVSESRQNDWKGKKFIGICTSWRVDVIDSRSRRESLLIVVGWKSVGGRGGGDDKQNGSSVCSYIFAKHVYMHTCSVESLKRSYIVLDIFIDIFLRCYMYTYVCSKYILATTSYYYIRKAEI